MLLKSADGAAIGVRCDITGQELLKAFEYYSASGKKVEVNTKIQKINTSPVSIDMDITEKGMEYIQELIIKHNAPQPANTIKCDLSGKIMSGTFQYYKLNLSKVEVEIEEADNSSAIKNVEENILDLNLSEEIMAELLEKQKTNREKPFIPPKTTKKVIRIPAPTEAPPQPEVKQIDENKEFLEKLEKKPKPVPRPAPKPDPVPEELEEPKPQETLKPEHNLVRKTDPIKPTYARVPGLVKKKFQPKHLHPKTPEPSVEFEPEEVTKVELPELGLRRNVKKRKQK